MDCIVHGVTKSRTRLSDFHFHFLSLHAYLNIRKKAPRQGIWLKHKHTANEKIILKFFRGKIRSHMKKKLKVVLDLSIETWKGNGGMP